MNVLETDMERVCPWGCFLLPQDNDINVLCIHLMITDEICGSADMPLFVLHCVSQFPFHMMLHNRSEYMHCSLESDIVLLGWQHGVPCPSCSVSLCQSSLVRAVHG
jgi:hypothetical protein